MARTTFQGPVRSGTVREGATANLGYAVLTQSYDTGDMTGTVVSNVDSGVVAYLPKGARIIDIAIDQVVAATTGSMTVSVGNAAAGAQLSAAVASTAGGRFRGTATAATQLAWQLSTTADTAVHVRVAVATDTLGAGRAIVTILYVQM